MFITAKALASFLQLKTFLAIRSETFADKWTVRHVILTKGISFYLLFTVQHASNTC
jgi:hypothetical protein